MCVCLSKWPYLRLFCLTSAIFYFNGSNVLDNLASALESIHIFGPSTFISDLKNNNNNREMREIQHMHVQISHTLAVAAAAKSLAYLCEVLALFINSFFDVYDYLNVGLPLYLNTIHNMCVESMSPVIFLYRIEL